MVHILLPILSVLTATLAAASPLVKKQATGNATTPASPAVTLYPAGSNGQPVKVTGLRTPTLNVDAYLGLPFAQPPVGELRLAPPQQAIYNMSSINATSQPPACMQNPDGSLLGTGSVAPSEDCLYVNVFTPAGANAQSAFLPVMVWIYGGSFTSGSITPYNASGIVAQSQLSQKPTIVVALNYRLGILGFGYGDAIAMNGAANLGIRDQVMALEWVQQNIWAFGGDPSRVTVFGESAGAISISNIFLQNRYDLFRGAIIQSGAASTAPIGPTDDSWQKPYDALVQALNCTSANATSAKESNQTSFECLKRAPAQAIITAQLAVVKASFGAFIFAPSVDGDLIPDMPSKLIAQGKFSKIPFISGNVMDEGTAFVPAPTLLSSQELVGLAVEASEPHPVPKDVLAELLTIYTDDPAQGSPFGTGNETFGLPSEFKQVAAIFGDAQFQSQRRYILDYAQQYGLTQVWSYQFEQPTTGAPPRLGIYHGTDVPPTFGFPQVSPNSTAEEKAVSRAIIDHWLSFANYLDPSQGTLPNATVWPKYGSERNMLRLKGDNMTIFPDTYREKMKFFTDNAVAFNQRRSLAF